MDSSQSSNSFPENPETPYKCPIYMDAYSYVTIVANTKRALSADIEREIEKATFFNYFTAVLEDCSTCINQSLDLVAGLIADTHVCIDKLSEYLTDAVCVLEMVSNFIKAVIQSVTMTCCSMKTFPITIGHIINAVFEHCRDSESLYGNNLSNVEKLLKNLFKNCHELQLTYLMILEKHFIFDLTEKKEKDLLFEALEINLKIGEIVQSLDVKTMAVQWKAYTMICEKYSTALSDSDVFQNCTQILCSLIRNNINIVLEAEQDDKVIIRALKIASFMIKILMKTCTIFKHSTRKYYDHIVELIFHIQITCHSQVELTAEMPQFKNLMNTNIIVPSECLLKELLLDDAFVNTLLNIDLETIKHDDILLGSILTIKLAMKCAAQDNRSKTATKRNLIACVYSVLPYCHVWFNQNLEISASTDSHGLFEDLLIHTVALAFTLDSEEYEVLEKHMIETILGTECYSALFSSSLWIVLARRVTPQLLFNQLIWLCNMYKKLEKRSMFSRSPQRVHLSYTISGLFEAMESEDKMKICKQFRVHDEDNVCLWNALRVNGSPAEGAVAEKLKMQFQNFHSATGAQEIDDLIKVMELAATCTFTNTRGIEEYVMKAWTKACPENFSVPEIDGSTVWFYDYLHALVALTNSIWSKLAESRVNSVKVLHVISGLIQQCSTEIKLLLIDALCKLATTDLCDDKLAETIRFTEAFCRLFQDSDDLIRNNLLIILRKYRKDKNLDKILSNVKDSSLQESWCNIKDGQILNESKDELMKAMDFNYSHKCFESKNVVYTRSSEISYMKKSRSNDFDDISNNISDNDSESQQPISKKVKLNDTECDIIIKRLEMDTVLLCNMKENVFSQEFKKRIQKVCDKLKNIVN